ncbi:MAG: type II toxin-antitoxin system HicB family antitoxin [Chitinivibrionia bacterium]|nr:type II toxin-antitoxin system HicB family antitoxin [Chitinivibrionia bacterium]
MQLNYIYTKHDDYYVGHLVDFPEYETQGETIEELEEMLKSLYSDLMIFDDIHSSVRYKSGVLEFA